MNTVNLLFVAELCPQMTEHLWKLVAHLYSQLLTLDVQELKLASGKSILRIPSQCPESPIFSILTPIPRRLAKTCQDAGFVVRPIVPPTVPEGGQRIRVCLHAGNSFEEVDKLAAVIADWVAQVKDNHGKDKIVELETMRSKL